MPVVLPRHERRLGDGCLTPAPPNPSFLSLPANSTYYNADAGTCVPCHKGLSTFGCAATSAQQCHKPCGAGLYWDAMDALCKKCAPGTYWPTTGLETDTCIPCTGAAPRQLRNKTASSGLGFSKYGAKSCPAYPNKPTKKPLGA